MAESRSIQIWEQAEIARSRAEASRTPIESLYVTEVHRQRYVNPPADTPYPLEYVFHLLDDVAGKVVLDLGCGKGGNSLLAVLRGARVVGIDVSAHALDLARARFVMNAVTTPTVFAAASA